jgi:hypothetical protein
VAMELGRSAMACSGSRALLRRGEAGDGAVV